KPKNAKGCVWSCDLSTRNQNANTNKYENKKTSFVEQCKASTKDVRIIYDV
ncbi:Hypothetical predicted protein, partial [Marmota monax]